MRAPIAAVCCVVAGLFPAAALAQAPGVTYDPDDPAGKQYALPLDYTRSSADGEASQSTGTAPLFGIGVSRSAPADAPRSKPSGGGGATSPEQEPSGATTRNGQASLTTEVGAALADGDSSRLRWGGLAALVVGGAGLLGGLAVRRLRR